MPKEISNILNLPMSVSDMQYIKSSGILIVALSENTLFKKVEVMIK